MEILTAVATIITLKNLVLILGGVVMGLIFGAIPGLTATLGIAMVIPLTFGLSPIEAMSTLGGIYVGGISGGLVSATLLNMPGTPSSICTTFDAAPMARQGKAVEALSIGVFASFVGGILSWLVLITLSPQLSVIALEFGPFEYFWLTILGFSVVIGLGGNDPSKAFLSVCIGLMITLIGIDPIDGMSRFTFGLKPLRSGFSLIPSMIGLFVIPELLLGIEQLRDRYVVKEQKIGKLKIQTVTRSIKKSYKNYLRSSAVGTLLGILPGVGGTIANFVCYDLAKKFSKTPEKFGTGEAEGIIASETGNNATTSGALIPTLTLGIPGDAVTAIMMGALLLHGLQPGPSLFTENPQFIYGFFIAILLANIIMLLVQFGGGIKFFIKALSVPKWFMFPIIIVMVVAGCWTLQYSVFDIWTITILGIVGYIFKKINYPLTPMVLGIILGPIMEEELRRAILYSDGNALLFFSRPYSLVIISIILLLMFLSVMVNKMKSGRSD